MTNDSILQAFEEDAPKIHVPWRNMGTICGCLLSTHSGMYCMSQVCLISVDVEEQDILDAIRRT